MARPKDKTPDPNLAVLEEAAQALQPAKLEEVIMEKDGVKTEVRNNESVQIMEAAGWKVVG